MGTRCRIWCFAAAACVLLAVLLAALLLRGEPDSYAVGDGAVLEIYTLHAAKGQLTVGPYSRFGWNHPGPMYFYGLAPAYLLSGHREESLLVSVLAANLVAIGIMLLVAARCGGWPHVLALMVWFVAYYMRPSGQHFWDFGDLLSSSWNPHAPLLPFGLLIILAAALSAGHLVMLPMIVGVASFVSQTHAAFLPLSVLIAGSAVLIWFARHRPFHLNEIPATPVTNWVRGLDVIAALYALLLTGVVLIGGFDLRLGPLRLSARSADKLLLYLLGVVAVRHALSRSHPLFRRLVASASVAPILSFVRRWLGAPRPWPSNTRHVVVAAAAVLALAWAVPLAGEFLGDRTGNLRRMIRSVGSERSGDLGAGVGGMAHQLTGVLRPDFEVAAGGVILTVGAATWPVVLLAVGQVVALLVAFARAVRRQRPFLAGLAATGLVASAGAVWASIRVGVELYDHLVFWVSMLGVVNLATLTAALFDRRTEMSPAASAGTIGRGSVVAVTVFVALMGLYGTHHLLLGHHRARFEADRQRVRALSEAVERTFAAGVPGPVRVDMAPDAWSVAAGIILRLYQQDRAVTVADEWVSLFGPALAPTGTETREIMVTDATTNEEVLHDSRYSRIASDGDIGVYHRSLVSGQ